MRVAKYDPDQPRIPKGMPGGGRWMSRAYRRALKDIYRATEGRESRPSYSSSSPNGNTFKWRDVTGARAGHLGSYEMNSTSVRASIKHHIQVDLTNRVMAKAEKDERLVQAIDAMWHEFSFPGDNRNPAAQLALSMSDLTHLSVEEYDDWLRPDDEIHRTKVLIFKKLRERIAEERMSAMTVVLLRDKHQQWIAEHGEDFISDLIEFDPEVKEAFRKDHVYAAMRSLVDAWAASSWNDPRSLYVQHRAEVMFGLDDAVGIGSVRRSPGPMLESLQGRVTTEWKSDDQWATGGWSRTTAGTPYWDGDKRSHDDPLDPQVVGEYLGAQFTYEGQGDRWSRFYKQDVDKLIDAFVESVYESTQEYLKSEGVDRVTVYRGTNHQRLPRDYGADAEDVLLEGEENVAALVARAKEVMRLSEEHKRLEAEFREATESMRQTFGHFRDQGQVGPASMEYVRKRIVAPGIDAADLPYELVWGDDKLNPDEEEHQRAFDRVIFTYNEMLRRSTDVDAGWGTPGPEVFSDPVALEQYADRFLREAVREQGFRRFMSPATFFGAYTEGDTADTISQVAAAYAPILSDIYRLMLSPVPERRDRWLADLRDVSKRMTELVGRQNEIEPKLRMARELYRQEGEYRGLKGRAGGLPAADVAQYPDGTKRIVARDRVGRVVLQPLSSFATDGSAAEPFGMVQVAVDLPAERVWSTSLTGPGCLREWEVIVLGGEYAAQVTAENAALEDQRVVEPVTKSSVVLVLDTPDEADWPKRTPDTFGGVWKSGLLWTDGPGPMALDRPSTRRTGRGLGAAQKAPARGVAEAPSTASSGQHTTPQSDLVEKALSRAWVDGYASIGTVSKAPEDPDEILNAAAEWARNRAGMLIAGRVNPTVIQSIIARSIEQGWPQDKTERAVARSIGLSPQDQQALFNYEKKLVDEHVPPGRRQRMVDALERKKKASRVRTIVQNETAMAFAAGKREAWRQMRSMGEVSPYAVRIWRTHKDERTCPVCGPLNGRRASLDEGRTYTLPTGVVTTGPPVHVNCRCWEELSDRGTPEIA